MNRNKDISDDLLLEYLSGTLEAGESKKLEAQLKEDASLQSRLVSLEEVLEKIAFENAQTPPPEVLIQLKERVQKVRPIRNKENSYNRIRLLVAAGFAAFFAVTSLWMYLQLEKNTEMLELYRQQAVQLEDRMIRSEADKKNLEARYRAINNPEVVPLVLYGNSSLPGGKAIAYLNANAREVVVNPQGLPSLEEDKTYQMWADVDGEMINMGLLPTDEELVSVQYIDRASSLNITIEPAGGSEHPTVEDLVAYVIL